MLKKIKQAIQRPLLKQLVHLSVCLVMKCRCFYKSAFGLKKIKLMLFSSSFLCFQHQHIRIIQKHQIDAFTAQMHFEKHFQMQCRCITQHYLNKRPVKDQPKTGNHFELKKWLLSKKHWKIRKGLRCKFPKSNFNTNMNITPNPNPNPAGF